MCGSSSPQAGKNPHLPLWEKWRCFNNVISRGIGYPGKNEREYTNFSRFANRGRAGACCIRRRVKARALEKKLSIRHIFFSCEHGPSPSQEMTFSGSGSPLTLLPGLPSRTRHRQGTFTAGGPGLSGRVCDPGFPNCAGVGIAPNTRSCPPMRTSENRQVSCGCHILSRRNRRWSTRTKPITSFFVQI